MNVIRMWGGLGNQLFIYALYEKFRIIGKETYIYLDKDSYLSHTNKNIIYQLPLLNLSPMEYDKSEKLHKYLTSQNLFVRLKRKFDGKQYFEKEHGLFERTVFDLDNKIITGYFQTEKYFDDISDTIRNKICFFEADKGKVLELAQKIKNENAISIHVRLTDYQQFNNLYGGICNKRYYQNAVEYIKNNISNPVFYIFSDDLQQALLMLKDYNCVPVDINRGEKSYLDMYLMSQCKHHIIANSSFSWWGAWLNSNPEKMVIAPSRWVNTDNTPDICPNSWIRLGNEE